MKFCGFAQRLFDDICVFQKNNIHLQAEKKKTTQYYLL